MENINKHIKSTKDKKDATPLDKPEQWENGEMILTKPLHISVISELSVLVASSGFSSNYHKSPTSLSECSASCFSQLSTNVSPQSSAK